MIIKFLLLLVLLISTNVFAHSGRTNINGCHIDHNTNREHCHGNNETPVKNDDENIIESNENNVSQSNAILFQKSTTESETKSDNEQKSSTSKFSAVLSVLYFFLAIMLIVAFGEVLKTAIEMFKLFNEKLESKTKFAVAISILLTVVTLSVVFLLIRRIMI